MPLVHERSAWGSFPVSIKRLFFIPISTNKDGQVDRNQILAEKRPNRVMFRR
jgi:hypothetical protein